MRKLLIFLGLAFLAATPLQAAGVRTRQVSIGFSCGRGCLWQDGIHRFAPPALSIDGTPISANVTHLDPLGTPIHLKNGATEYWFTGPLAQDVHLKLQIQFQVNDETPVIRFRYTLKSDQARRMTTPGGAQSLTYLQTSLRDLPDVKEVSLSNFAQLTHSYTLAEQAIDNRYFEDRGSFMGPILAAGDGRRSFLLAYEHGSQVPDAFLQYQLSPNRDVRLVAVKGNYLSGQTIDDGHSWQSVWMETAATEGSIDELASTYRRFVLKYMAQNTATRIPYIFYNTWNFQERNKWWNGKPYLESMNEERMLKEIDVAHRMGIDVFVLDTGWYEKTGDWTVSRQRFPDGLKTVKQKLDSYGMKLGLWFGPTTAAVSSRVVREHPEWRRSWNGEVAQPQEVWETEKSYKMCMVSGYADAFADELIRLAREVGVTYFKWDAIAQYGCNDPHHNHGGENNTPQERSDSYAFQLVQYMSHVADKVAAAVPGAIVDFDVTEAGRSVGLAFLSSGKYFLINNGPYYQNYDIPIDLKRTNSNLFFYQGQARTWIARTPLTFDKWIPSTLFLTHYFPDDPQQWQEVDVASLILGQDGIWGDLLNISDSGVAFFASALGRFKRVRDDITESDPVVTGIVSASPEIHEKISASTGRGAVVIFATERGTYRYITRHKVAPKHWASEGVAVSSDPAGRARIEANFDRPGAKILFFGVR
ncbi:MAG TPA: alpha-galactosidase [Acidobacteriaceae bacterium]|nr:alpha-galactosidase [Acidobacteriaceae bacterium]